MAKVTKKIFERIISKKVCAGNFIKISKFQIDRDF